MRILFVDDCKERHARFKRECGPQCDTDYAFDADSALSYLDAYTYDLIFLDHDLDEKFNNQTIDGLKDGRYIARHLIAKYPRHHKATIICHSLNTVARTEMYAMLRDCGFPVISFPFAWREPLRRWASLKVLFLDIDGVLNDHTPNPAGFSTIQQDKATRLNRVTDTTGALLVLSSAWRYLMVGGAMTQDGFEYLLRICGVRGKLIGYTQPDENVKTRGQQIQKWLDENPLVYKYAVVDDLDNDEQGTIRISEAGHPLVQTDANTGLTDNDVEQLIGLLK